MATVELQEYLEAAASPTVTKALAGDSLRQQSIAKAGMELIEQALFLDSQRKASPFVSPLLALGVTAKQAIRVRMSDELRSVIEHAEAADNASMEAALDEFVTWRILERAAEIVAD